MRWPQGAGLGLCGDWWDCVRPPPELRFAMGGVRWKRTLVVACQKVANAWANQTQSSGCNSPIKSFRRIPKGWATNSLIDLCDSSMGYTDPRTGRPIYIGKGQEQQNLRPPQRPGLPLLPRSELSPPVNRLAVNVKPNREHWSAIHLMFSPLAIRSVIDLGQQFVCRS